MDSVLQAVHSAVDHVTDALALLEELTGLPPLVLFTVLALLVGAYYLVSGIVAPSQIGASPLEAGDEPSISEVQVREMTIEQLGDYDGRDPSKPLFMAIKGQVYDISLAKDFYGPGAPYSVFAGKDASRALAKMSFQAGDLTGDLEGLTDQELEVLKEWEVKFDGKYPKVGVVGPGLKQHAQVAASREAEHKVEEEPPRQTHAQAAATKEAEHKVEEEPLRQTHAQVASTREAEHKVEEEPPRQTHAEVADTKQADHKVVEEPPRQTHAQVADMRQGDHKVEEESPKPSYAQVAASKEAQHKVDEDVKQEREVKSPRVAGAKEHGEADNGESVKSEGQVKARELEQRKHEGESEDGEAKAKPTAARGAVEQSIESSSELKPHTEDGDRSSSITRDVPVSAGERPEREDGNESSVVTRDIPVSGGQDEPMQQQEEAEAEEQNEVDENKLRSGTLEQRKEVEENRLSTGTLEQVLEPSKGQYVIGRKQSQDEGEKDFELVDKGKVPDPETLLSIRDSDYIRGLQDVGGL